MGTEPNDPIKDLIKEIEAEEAADAESQAAAGAAEADDGAAAEAVEAEELAAEAGEEANGEEKETVGAASETKPDGDAKAKKLVPASRLDEETAKRRIAERKNVELEARIARLEKKTEPTEATEDGEKTPEQLRAEVREQVRREMKVEAWLAAGHDQYGEEEFEARSKDLSALNPPDYLLPVLFEAMDDNMKRSSTAIYMLAEQDPAEVAKVFKMSPIRLATYLQKLVARRPSKEDAEEEPKPKPVKPKAPKPITPVRTGQTVNGYNFSDEMSDEEFSSNFTKMMEKRPN